MRHAVKQIANDKGWGYKYQSINEANVDLDEACECSFPLLIHLRVQSGQFKTDSMGRVKDQTLDIVHIVDLVDENADEVIDNMKQEAKSLIIALNQLPIEWLDTVSYTTIEDNVFDRDVAGVSLILNLESQIGSCR